MNAQADGLGIHASPVCESPSFAATERVAIRISLASDEETTSDRADVRTSVEGRERSPGAQRSRHHCGDECDERRRGRPGSATQPGALGAAEGHSVRDGEHDAGKRHVRAGVENQRAADRLVPVVQRDQTDDRARGQEQVVEALAKRPQPDVLARDVEDPWCTPGRRNSRVSHTNARTYTIAANPANTCATTFTATTPAG